MEQAHLHVDSFLGPGTKRLPLSYSLLDGRGTLTWLSFRVSSIKNSPLYANPWWQVSAFPGTSCQAYFLFSVLNGDFLAAQHQADFPWWYGSTYLACFLVTWHQANFQFCLWWWRSIGLACFYVPSPKVILISVYVLDVGGSFTWWRFLCIIYQVDSPFTLCSWWQRSTYLEKLSDSWSQADNPFCLFPWCHQCSYLARLFWCLSSSIYPLCILSEAFWASGTKLFPPLCVSLMTRVLFLCNFF